MRTKKMDYTCTCMCRHTYGGKGCINTPNDKTKRMHTCTVPLYMCYSCWVVFHTVVCVYALINIFSHTKSWIK